MKTQQKAVKLAITGLFISTIAVNAHAGNDAIEATTSNSHYVGLTIGTMGGALLGGPAGAFLGGVVGHLFDGKPDSKKEFINDVLMDSFPLDNNNVWVEEAAAQEQTEPLDVAVTEATDDTIEATDFIRQPEALLSLQEQTDVVNQPEQNEMAFIKTSLVEEKQEASPMIETDSKLRSVLASGFGLDVLFRSGSTDVENYYLPRLASLSALMHTLPELEIQLDGYSDRIGDEETNLEVSKLRLNAVRQFLVSTGIEVDRINTNAHGEENFISKEGDVGSYSYDRRVVISFSPQAELDDTRMAANEVY